MTLLKVNHKLADLVYAIHRGHKYVSISHKWYIAKIGKTNLLIAIPTNKSFVFGTVVPSVDINPKEGMLAKLNSASTNKIWPITIGITHKSELKILPAAQNDESVNGESAKTLHGFIEALDMQLTQLRNTPENAMIDAHNPDEVAVIIATYGIHPIPIMALVLIGGWGGTFRIKKTSDISMIAVKHENINSFVLVANKQ